MALGRAVPGRDILGTRFGGEESHPSTTEQAGRSRKTGAAKKFSDMTIKKSEERSSISGLTRNTDYSSGLNTDRISVPSSAGVTCVTMLTCSTSSSPE